MAYNEALALEDDSSFDESSNYSHYSDISDDSDEDEPPKLPSLPDEYKDKVFQLAIIQGFDPVDIERELRGEPVSIPAELQIHHRPTPSKLLQKPRFNEHLSAFGTWTSQALEKLDDEHLKQWYGYVSRREPPSQLNRHDIIKQLLEWQHAFNQPYVPTL